MGNRARALPGALFAGAAVAAAAILLYEGRGLTFTGDEWSYLGHLVNDPRPASLLSSPGSDYLMVIPLFLYARLLDAFGAASYIPYRVVGVSVHLLCASLLFLLLRRRVGPLA